MTSPHVVPHIRIVTPHIAPVPHKLAEVADIAARAGVSFSQANITSGPVSIQSAFDEAMCAPGVVAQAMAAEEEGVDAVIIDCFADPALRAAREAVSIPVIGPGSASLHAAALHAHRIGVVTIMESVRAMIEDQVQLAGLSGRVARVRTIDMPVRSLQDHGELLLARLIDASVRSVLDDGVDHILLGCTGFLGVDRTVADALHERGLVISVTSPLRAAAMAAISAIHLNLRHSPRAYVPARVRRSIP